jgi:hypothetical protein
MRRIGTRVLAGAMLGAGLLAVPASAGLLPFNGSLMTSTPPLVIGGAPCGPGQALNSTNPGNSTQTTSSTFGSFGYTNIHCVPFPPVPPFSISGGVFTFAFAGGDLSGDYSAETSPTGDPLVFNVAAAFAVTGGTGLFAGATGLISGIGTVDRSGASPIFTQALTGVIDAPAIPEPATWGLMILGFGAVGFAARQRRAALPV